MDSVLANCVLLTPLDLDDEDLLEVIVPPKGLVLVWGQINLNINGRVKKLGEGVGERLELGGGAFGIPHEQGMAAAIVRLRLSPREVRLVVHEASIAHDP